MVAAAVHDRLGILDPGALDLEPSLKPISEMLDLLLDEDPVVVKEADLCFKLMALNDGSK